MTNIHPTAIISDKAVIGADCEIGPYSVIGDHVRLGDKCKLHSHVVLDRWTTIGANNEFYPFACIGKQSQDLKYKGSPAYVNIGSGNVFREYVTVNTATDGETTRIGNNNSILAYSHVAHDCILGNHIVVSSNVMIAGHSVIDDHAIINGYSGIVQFCRIGRGAYIGGFSKVSKDVLPYTIADGAPAELRTINKIGMERQGISAETIAAVNKAYKILIRSGLVQSEALEKLRADFADVPEVQEMVTFTEKSVNGLARPKLRD